LRAAHARVRAIRPHRCYRRLTTPLSHIVPCILITLAIEVLVILGAQPLEHLVSTVDASIAGAAHVPVTLGSERFLWLNLAPLEFTMPSHDYIELAAYILVSAVAIGIISIFRLFPAPLRFFVNFNFLIVAGEASYLLLAGHLGYDSNTFSTLMLETMTAIWLVLPLFIGTVTILFPFTLLASIAIILSTVVFDIVLAASRYAAFIVILNHSGPILMADLYLSFGPLLDVIPLTGIFAIFLGLLARRLRRDPEAWAWL
jgi:hypothetical protein